MKRLCAGSLTSPKEREFENGKAEEKISIALRLLSVGTMSQEDIAKVTNLTIEKIKELASQTTSAAHA